MENKRLIECTIGQLLDIAQWLQDTQVEQLFSLIARYVSTHLSHHTVENGSEGGSEITIRQESV